MPTAAGVGRQCSGASSRFAGTREDEEEDDDKTALEEDRADKDSDDDDDDEEEGEEDEDDEDEDAEDNDPEHDDRIGGLAKAFSGTTVPLMGHRPACKGETHQHFLISSPRQSAVAHISRRG